MKYKVHMFIFSQVLMAIKLSRSKLVKVQIANQVLVVISKPTPYNHTTFGQHISSYGYM